jgi:hypothetical protein
VLSVLPEQVGPELVGVPEAVYVMPHVPLTHVLVWQSVSVPWQSLGVMQPTQVPLPSQTPDGQGVPAGAGAKAGVPPVQVAFVQSFGAVGTFESSTTWPQTPAVHATAWQAAAVVDVQSAALAHWTQTPPAQ